MIQLITTLFVTLSVAISPRAVVPLPVSVTEMEGTCTLQQNPTLKVVCKSDCEGVDALKDYAKDELGWTLSEKRRHRHHIGRQEFREEGQCRCLHP